jgi:hypothetical protein
MIQAGYNPTLGLEALPETFHVRARLNQLDRRKLLTIWVIFSHPFRQVDFSHSTRTYLFNNRPGFNPAACSEPTETVRRIAFACLAGLNRCLQKRITGFVIFEQREQLCPNLSIAIARLFDPGAALGGIQIDRLFK